MRAALCLFGRETPVKSTQANSQHVALWHPAGETLKQVADGGVKKKKKAKKQEGAAEEGAVDAGTSAPLDPTKPKVGGSSLLNLTPS